MAVGGRCGRMKSTGTANYGHMSLPSLYAHSYNGIPLTAEGKGKTSGRGPLVGYLNLKMLRLKTRGLLYRVWSPHISTQSCSPAPEITPPALCTQSSAPSGLTPSLRVDVGAEKKASVISLACTFAQK